MNWKFLPLHSLKARVTVFTLVIFLVCIWSLSFYTSRMLREDMQRSLGDQQFSTASVLAAQVNSALDERLRLLENIAANLTPALLGKPAALQAFLEQRPVLKRLFNGGVLTLLADGTAIAEVPLSAGRIGVNYMDRDHVAAALQEEKSKIGRPLMDRMLKAPIIGMAVPIRDAQGKVIGALGGVVNLGLPNFLSGIMEQRYGKTGGYLLVAPQHRLIVTASDKRHIMEDLRPLGHAPLAERYLQGFEGSDLMVNPLGAEVLVSIKGIPATGWYLSAMLPAAEAFAPVHDMQRRMLLATIMLTLLAGGLTWWMLRRELAPMVAAARTLAILDTNGPMKPLPIATQDEVGELIGGFNRLLETLGQREATLRDSEERYRTLIEWTPEPYVVHRDGNILYVNPAAVRIFGASSAQEIVGKPILDLIHPDYRQIALTRVKKILDQGTAVPMVVHRLLKLDATAFDAEIQSTSIFYAGDEAIYTVLRDISDRKHREETQARLAAIVECSNDAILSRSLDGTILSWNAGAEKMLGFTASEMIGNAVSIMRPPGVPPRMAKNNDMLSLGGVFTYESKRLTKDGRVIDVLSSHSPIRDRAGNIVGASVIIQDITTRKRAEAECASLEAQLREAQKMQAIGTLAGGIAHDFNNIIAAILGNAELARQDSSANPQALESLAEISKAGSRARDLVHQILAFSRREPSERKPVVLAPIIEESVRLLRTMLPARVELELHCDADVPAVLADANQIEQALINLATNAMQAMRGNAGHIAVRLNSVTLDAALAGAHPALQALQKKHQDRPVRLVVSDDGPGMDAATLERIFEPFFTTKAVDEGTGLGLSVVHGIVQAHEGTIVAESAPGKGATFTIYLPIAEAPIAAAPRVPAAASGDDAVATVSTLSGAQHILYLDDDEALVYLVRRLLERQGFRVSGYIDQSEALAALRAAPQRFDLVLTDYNMPGMSGLEVAREVRVIRAGLPVAIASGFIDETLRAEAGGAGVRELIFKADAVEEFCAVVQRLAQTVGAASKSA